MNKYELMLISPPDLSEKAWHEELADVRDMLKKNTSGVFFEDLWGLKPFAYNLKKFDRGYYGVLYFEAEPEQIFEVRANIKLNPHVIRHLLLILPEGFEVKKYEEFFGSETMSVTDGQPSRPRRAPRKMEEVKEVFKEPSEAKKPVLAGKEEEDKLKSVEETLSKILDNPDISLK